MNALYVDEYVRGAIVGSLRKRGFDALTVVEDGRQGASDEAVLDRAASLDRILYTEDDDFLVEAARRHESGLSFAGIVYAHPLVVPIGTAVEHLDIILSLAEPHELDTSVTHLPLPGLF